MGEAAMIIAPLASIVAPGSKRHVLDKPGRARLQLTLAQGRNVPLSGIRGAKDTRHPRIRGCDDEIPFVRGGIVRFLETYIGPRTVVESKLAFGCGARVGQGQFAFSPLNSEGRVVGQPTGRRE